MDLTALDTAPLRRTIRFEDGVTGNRIDDTDVVRRYIRCVCKRDGIRNKASGTHGLHVSGFVSAKDREVFRSFIIILQARTSGILRKIDQVISVVIHSILTLRLRAGFVITVGIVTATEVLEVGGSVSVVVDAILAFRHAKGSNETHELVIAR